MLKLSWNRRGGQRISGEVKVTRGDLEASIWNCPTAYSKYRKKHPFNIQVPLLKIEPKRPKQFFKELIWSAFDRGWLTWFSLNEIAFEYWAKDMKYKREREK